ncbi:MAG: DUF5662 family protein [Bacilli bacterium]|nr:DUF5662 family protein [Bacilli bacterium]
MKHRHLVIKHGWKMGIFFQALRHDLSKYSYTEFHLSAKYYVGNHSPVYEERIRNEYFSSICQHHSKRNKHHWEYWTDFFAGRVLAKTMPYKYAVEYVCDTISASKTYNGKSFTRDFPIEYWRKYNGLYYMSQATKAFICWCLERYQESEWKELKKKSTKAKYQEIISCYPNVDIIEQLTPYKKLPPLK